MNAVELKELLASVTRLTRGQRAELVAALGVGLGLGGEDTQVCALLESRLSQLRACPHCEATRLVRNGSASGLQR